MRWLWCFLFYPFHVEGLRAINTYGLETELAFQCGLSCCWVNNNSYYIQKVKDLGFDAIRLPYSAEYINRGDFTFMDEIINKTGELNMSVILDYHRTWAGHQGNWYETNLNDFLRVWENVLSRYSSRDHVRYVDLFNEFQDGHDKADFWNDIMTQAILHLENKFPFRWHYFVGGTNWGGSLQGIKVNLTGELETRISYTIHKYQWSVMGDYRQDYNMSFNGYSGDKLFIGEFGWIQSNPTQVEWARMFLAYLKEHNITNTALWCMSFYSGDTQGILQPNCLDVEQDKLKMLLEFWTKKRILRIHK